MNEFNPNTVADANKVNENFAGLADGSLVQDYAIEPPKWTNPYCFSAYKNGDQSINHATVTVVTGFTERFDYAYGFDYATGFYTVQLDGVYSVSVGALIDNLAAGDTAYSYIYRNEDIIQRAKTVENATGHETTGTLTALVDCVYGDTLSLRVYHDYGSARNVLSGSYTWISANLIHPL